MLTQIKGDRQSIIGTTVGPQNAIGTEIDIF